MLNKAKQKFGWQSRSAKKRGIEMQLSFDEWYQWWLDHGVDKLTETMPMCGDKLVMCRINDTGPYSLSNIYCATAKQNAADRWNNPGVRNKVMTPDGIFINKTKAAEFYNITPQAINGRMAYKPEQYYFMEETA